jgi:signal transduction histidine kinase
MSLASRLSAFFLASLAAVLLGFSATLYALASDHLPRQVDERLEASLATLAAAAEVGRDGVEWEPGERDLGLGRDAGADQVRWVVRDGLGRELDRSPNLDPRLLSSLPPTGSTDGRFLGRDGLAWRTRSRRVASPGPIAPEDRGGHQDSPDGAHPGPGHDAITLVAFAPLGPTEATLRRLALTLILLSTALWLMAAVVGRRLCRRALAPLSRMATSARDADAADPATRLPLPGTGDELEDLGQAFNGLLDRLHEALERQRRFTGDASHQLRTPLAGLLSQVDVALRRERPPGEYRRVLGVVRTKAAQLRQIIESLLFLARPESESGCPEMGPVDLSGWVPEHLRGWSTHPRSGDIRLSLEEKGPLRVRAHPSLLSQLLDNLLENSCKYSQPGTPIVVRLSRGPAVAVLAVEDRGCGLSAVERARVFEPFYRAPGARSRGQSGVGLGLAVAQRIVAVFGGAIRVESEPGAGSRFELSLPRTSAASAAPIVPGTPPDHVIA